MLKGGFMRIFRRLFLISLTALSLISCSKKETYNFSDTNMVSLYEAGTDSQELTKKTQLWHKSNDCVVILFGYGYNDKEFVTKTQEELFPKYGNYYENGRLLTIVFPDDFKHGTRTYSTNLANILNDKEVSALIILGAPEGTYKSIARLQDSYEGTLPFPVISFFSQDDVLGMEYSSDFLLDKTQKASMNGIIELESDQEKVESISEILDKALFLADISEAPFAKNENLLEIVKMVAGNLHISRYTDPETGLISINHFVID